MYICKNNNFKFISFEMVNSNLMKKFLCFLCVTMLVVSCKKNDKIVKDAEEIPLTIEVDRYDKAFFESKPQDLPMLKAKYPDFFPPGIDEKYLAEKMVHPMWRQLYQEVEKRYNNFDAQKTDIEKLFKYIKYYYPETKTPKVITVIQDMDPDYKVIYSRDKNVLIISLELYLGKDHKFYEYPNYQKKTFEPTQMLPDIVESFSHYIVKPPSERDFLSQMVYAGKQMYLKDVLLPETSEEDKICYTTEELKWCDDNDVEVWKYFVEENMLYSTSSKLTQNFIAPGPFSKFGMDTDKDTPARIGVWFGWQIVRSFMENNNVPVQKLMLMDAKEIFQKSKFKPTK